MLCTFLEKIKGKVILTKCKNKTNSPCLNCHKNVSLRDLHSKKTSHSVKYIVNT